MQMVKIVTILTKILLRFWRGINFQASRRLKLILIVVFLCLTLRTIPEFVPIRAADLAQDGQAVEFSDRDGLPLGTLLTRDQNHTIFVPLSQVSPDFIHAIIAAEDQRFYHHGALDLSAIARAILEAIQAKKIMSGASTITMQLARILSPHPSNLLGKIQEIWLAWRLTAGMSKDEILFAYINRLPMGGNIYGIEAAARTYFGMSAAELNLARSTILAAIPNDPNYFNPNYIWTPLKKRQKYILDRMVQDQYITKVAAEQAEKETILTLSPNQGIIAAPHFLFWLANQLPQAHSAQIRTTIDRPLQQFIEAQVKQLVQSLTPNNVHHAAALVIDNHTSEVLAYVGSPDYFNQTEMGRNDGVQALRQPGSTLKPFLYELALANHIIYPQSILADIPTYYAIPDAKLYTPIDYNETFQGAVRVRIALANSLNIPAVRLLEKVGVETFLTRLQQLGFEHLNYPPEYYGLGLTLGSGEVSLWELAHAYLILAKLGTVTPLVTTINENQPQLKITQIDPPTNWALITDILSDRYARSTAFGVDSVLSLPFPTAVKTGTSSDFRDTWTVGFTTDYTVATWVGNFNGERMEQVSGVMGAAPLWNRIMLHLHEDHEPGKFPPPEGLIKLPICAQTGLPPQADCTSLVQEYINPEDQKNVKIEPKLVTRRSLKIAFPKNDDYFLIYPNESQKLEFQLSTKPPQPVEWQLNGKKLALQSTNSLFWQLQPGEWTLQIKMGDLIDQVNFQVQLAENKHIQRGFSLGN